MLQSGTERGGSQSSKKSRGIVQNSDGVMVALHSCFYYRILNYIMLELLACMLFAVEALQLYLSCEIRETFGRKNKITFC